MNQMNSSNNAFKVVEGNLLLKAEAGEFDAIVHGCNCFCSMGGGIALAIAKKWPEVVAADNTTIRGDITKLGKYTQATVEQGKLTIVNLYTQFGFDKKINTEYDAIRDGFALIKQEFTGKRIGIPMIGAGIGGGDWNVIKELIGNALAGEDVTLVVFKP